MIKKRIIITFIAVCIALVFLFPFFWVIVTGFKTSPEASAWPPTILPAAPTLSAYHEVWKTFPFPRWFFNSIVIAGGTTLAILFLTSLAAYAFAYYRFPGHTVIFFLILSGLIVPMHLRMIPTFLLIKSLNLLDSYQGLIIPQIASNCALGIFLLTQYNKYIPEELIAAARIDGCGEFRIYASIILPLTKPALITLGIFVFLYSWNNFLWPLIVVQEETMKTLPVGLLDLAPIALTHKMTWPQRMAGTSIVIVPIVTVFFLFRNLFIKSFVISGLKG